MRVLFICIFLGTLVWLSQKSPDAFSEPTVHVGFLLIFPAILATMLSAVGFPTPVGALLAGLFLSFSGLLPESLLTALLPYSSLAIIWIGLRLGVSFSTAQIRNRRLLLASCLIVAASTLTAFSILLILGLPLRITLQISCLAGFSAPLWILASNTSETYPLSLYTTLLSFLVWSAAHISDRPLPGDPIERFDRWDILLFLVSIELVVLGFRHIRTRPGRYLLFGLSTGLILMAAWIRAFSPFALALAVGFALSLRLHKHRDDVQVLEILSSFLVPFVLADFILRLRPTDLFLLTSSHWHFLITYILAMALGKLIGALLVVRTTGIPLRNQIPLLQQGLVAGLVFKLTFSSFLLPPPLQASAHALTAGMVILCWVCLPVILLFLQWGVQKIKNGRLRAAARTT